MAGRQIIYSVTFDHGVDRLGGYRAVDRILETILDGLYRNPYGFPKFESDYVSFRYVLTKGTAEMPPLIVIFSIDEKGDVTLEHIEERMD